MPEYTPVEGLCCDCLKCGEPFFGDFSENLSCPCHKDDGSCWDGGDGDAIP